MDSGDDSLYDPFDKLVRIRIEGRSFAVPENNMLLRCVQFIVDEGVVLGRFCWNNECGNCEVTLQTADHAEPHRARGCQTPVQAGMILSELTPDLRYWLHRKSSGSILSENSIPPRTWRRRTLTARVEAFPTGL